MTCLYLCACVTLRIIADQSIGTTRDVGVCGCDTVSRVLPCLVGRREWSHHRGFLFPWDRASSGCGPALLGRLRDLPVGRGGGLLGPSVVHVVHTRESNNSRKENTPRKAIGPMTEYGEILYRDSLETACNNCMQHRFGTQMAHTIACGADLAVDLATCGTLQLDVTTTTTPSIRGTQ